MCGIAGFFSKNNASAEDRFVLQQMAGSLSHRGPDFQGCWLDQNAGIGLAHSRLAIIDISPEGNQPMVSESGRYVIAFNGEIYNFKELRGILESKGYIFRGHSDTEVMLAAIEEWGIDAAIRKFNGMFAFSLWDRAERTLSLARDRLGEKPLYYGWQNDTFLFGSELKALRRHPQWTGGIDRNILTLFFRYNYIPAPYSIHPSIYKLKPGTYRQLDFSQFPPKETTTVYWSLHSVVETGMMHQLDIPEQEVLAELENLLKKSVRRKMISDVPLGAFLSGGIDSATVVALMQGQSDRPVQTFTIGFHDKRYNEAVFAKTVAEFLGTEHHEMYVSASDLQDVIPIIPASYDEPFADSSQIPTFLISSFAKKYVTVCLSGDGGDEVFGGYNRYFLANKVRDFIRYCPIGIRRALIRILGNVSPMQWEKYVSKFSSVTPSELKSGRIGDKICKLLGLIDARDGLDIYQRLISTWRDPADLVINAEEPYSDNFASIIDEDYSQQMMLRDTLTYLPDDILVKVDRATMANSLEARVPFLDHDVVEFAWRIPFHMKVSSKEGKRILKQVLHKYIPQELMNRPKSGFAMPIGNWLRESLRDWAEALLSEERLKDDGLLDCVMIRNKWSEHLSDKKNWQDHLWSILMFQAWLNTQRENFH